MRDRVLTSSEVMHIQYNIRQIEKELGHPIPTGVLDVSELKENLSSYEIDRICHNIKQVERHDTLRRDTNHIVGDSFIEKIIGFAILAFGVLLYFFS